MQKRSQGCSPLQSPGRELETSRCSGPVLVSLKPARHSEGMVRLSFKARVAALTSALSCSLLACAGGKETSPEEHAFLDAAGRSCHATLEKTSPSAPSVSEAVSCNEGARVCSSESAPCFELNVTTDSYAVMNCPACCRGSASSYVSADCSPILCDSNADCIYQRAVCTDGACVCPNGVCE